MSDSAESIQRYGVRAAVALGGVGVLTIVGSALWWFYSMVQDGLTSSELGTIGMSLLVGALTLWMLFGMKHRQTGKSIFEALTGVDSDD